MSDTEETIPVPAEPPQEFKLEPEQLRLMQAAALQAERFEASETCRYIIEKIKVFEEGLNENEELGLRLANFGVAAQLHIRAIGFKDPNIIEFHGLDDQGNRLSVLQHLTQLSILFVALKPVEGKAYRVGFDTPDIMPES